MSLTEDRRNATRLLRDEHLMVTVVASPQSPELAGTQVECSTVDVSAEGMRILLECPVIAGARVALAVRVLERGESYQLDGAVMWSRETEAAGVYLIGVRLLEGESADLVRWRELFF